MKTLFQVEFSAADTRRSMYFSAPLCADDDFIEGRDAVLFNDEETAIAEAKRHIKKIRTENQYFGDREISVRKIKISDEDFKDTVIFSEEILCHAIKP